MPDQHTPTPENQQEEWRSVIGYEGLYAVSNVGRVRRLAGSHGTPRDRFLTPRIGLGGYWTVCLSKHNRHKEAYLHRLVAAAFIGECPEGMQVNHKDSNRLNACADNLEYVTYSENARHRDRNGAPWRRGEKNPVSKLTEADVRELRQSKERHVDAARRLGVGKATIIYARQGKSWKSVI